MKRELSGADCDTARRSDNSWRLLIADVEPSFDTLAADPRSLTKRQTPSEIPLHEGRKQRCDENPCRRAGLDQFVPGWQKLTGYAASLSTSHLIISGIAP
jgi:hypothetical protein